MAQSGTIALITSLCYCLATCFGYSISPCGNNDKVQIEERYPVVFTCTCITHDDMVWMRHHTTGQVSEIGRCSWPSGTCNVADSSYRLSRPERASSVLTVTRNPRLKISGAVMCAGLNPEGNPEGTVKCGVRIVYTSYQVTNCTVKVNTSTSPWAMSGSCDVNKIYASDRRFGIRWFERPQAGWGSRPFPGTVDVVSSFKEEGWRVYYKVKCHFSLQPRPTADDVYSYLLQIDPFNGIHSANTVTIQSPAGPPVLHNCPDSMVEGDDDTCTCQASTAEPSALVTWAGCGTTAVNGETTLPLNGVPKSLDGHNYTCSQFWGGHSTEHMKTTVYTLHIEYPPSSPPQISGNTTGMEGDSLVLSCTVTGGNPPVVNVVFYCGSHGDNTDSASTEDGHTVVTSTVEINSLTARDSGSQCLCFAKWRPRPALYQTTSAVTILVLASEPSGQSTGESTPEPATGQSTGESTPEPATTVSGATSTTGKPSTRSKDDGDADLKLAALVGGIVGGLAAVNIIALIIVIICLWKRIREPLYAEPATGRQDDDHNYTELDHYQQIGPPEQRTERIKKGTMDQHSDVNPWESRRHSTKTRGSARSQLRLTGNTKTRLKADDQLHLRGITKYQENWLYSSKHHQI